MSQPGGSQVPVSSVYGRTPTQTPAWGGPNLRWGDTNPGVNAGYAATAMPGTPGGYQQAFSALAGTPWSSNPNQYGRWNWATQQGQQQPPQPPSPYTPQPYQPQQPAPYQPQQPQQPSPYQPQQPQPAAPAGDQSAQQIRNSINNGRGFFANAQAGADRNDVYSPEAIAKGMNVGDIWSNVAFANAMAAQNTGGGGIFG